MALGKAVLVLPILLNAALGASRDSLGVNAVRYWTISDVTRIAVEFNGSFKFTTARLEKPERVFYDFKGARQHLSGRGVHVISVGDGRVKQVRVAESSASTRIVVDLEDAKAEVTASELTLPDRLMIEVRGKVSPPVQAEPVITRKTTPPPVMSKPEPTFQAVDLSSPRKKNSPPADLPEPPALPAAAPVSPAAQAEPAKRNSNGDRSLTRVLGLKVRRVVIDPGHGGHDHGTTGVSGVIEKELVLDVAKRLGTLIKEELGAEVIYTRTTDTFIPLEERSRIANAQKADLFLSIHANSSPIKSANGSESYYLNFTNSRASLELAARENAASDRSISELKDLIQKIALREKAEESREFAARIQSSLLQLNQGNSKNRPRDRGVKRAPFVVLINSGMPSVLVELGFLTNSKEEGMFKKTDHRQKVAEALLRGITDYANTLSRFEVAKR